MSGRALVVGLGGLGCPAATRLADAGVAQTLCDFDKVEARNLGRQPLYTADDIGFLKVECAADALVQRGASVTMEPHTFDPILVEGHEVVLDCTDDPAARAYIHQSCLAAGVPLVWAAVDRADGQLATVMPGGPCLRCLWPEPDAGPPCGEDTDISTLRVVGTMQAEAALEVLAGTASGGQLHLFHDGWGPTETITFPRRQACICANA